MQLKTFHYPLFYTYLSPLPSFIQFTCLSLEVLKVQGSATKASQLRNCHRYYLYLYAITHMCVHAIVRAINSRLTLSRSAIRSDCQADQRDVSSRRHRLLSDLFLQIAADGLENLDMEKYTGRPGSTQRCGLHAAAIAVDFPRFSCILRR